MLEISGFLPTRKISAMTIPSSIRNKPWVVYQGVEIMDHEAFRAFINRHEWTFAKTYAAFCPHEYIVMKKLPAEEHPRFPEIAQFIRDKGFIAKYGRLEPRSYYIVDEYYYWTMDEKAEDTDLINRAKLTDFDFVKTENGTIVRRHV